MIAKKLLVGAFLILAGAGTALASAAPVDPSIILRDASCGTGCQVINESNFSFTVGDTQGVDFGGGVFDFQDEFGDITSLTFILQNPGDISADNLDSLVNCQVLSYFNNCSKSIVNGNIEIVFSNAGDGECSGDKDEDDGVVDSDGGNNGHNECNGIPKGTIFTLDLNDPGNPNGGSWSAGSSVSGIINTPEPGTLLLLLTAVPLIGLRKRQ